MPTKLRIVAAILLVASVAPLHADDERDRDRHRHHPRPEAPRLEALYQGAGYDKGLVAVANPHAAEAGAKILEHGGNAIDAAVAIAYALNVVEPQSAGIGGGGFMMIHLAKSGRTVIIDSREKAPAGATPDMFVGVPSASLQGVAVGVPGMVRGTETALRDYGTMGFAQVLQPAIELADQGFAATPRFVSSTACANPASRARNSPESSEYFCPGGQSREVGSLVTNKPLAETLRTIARHGPEAFYTGEIAHAIVEGQKRASAGGQPGTMTMADLAAYEATRRAPVSGTYRGWTIKGMDSPSSGGLAVMQMLEMIERFPIGNAGAGFGFGSANTLNVMAEAMRTAFADRAVWMGDADFSYVPAKGLLHPTYTALRSGPIAPTARMSPNPVAGDPRSYDTVALRRDATLLAQAEPSFAGPGGSTTHFVVGDRWGNLVSYTNTIESGYGAGMFAGYYPPGCADVSCFKSYGFLLNNELTDFNFVPSASPFTGKPATNDVAPGKRPRSSMAPTMIFDARGRPVAAYGSPGGSTIINSVLNVTLNVIDHGMTIQQAIDAPRLSVTAAGGAIAIDVGNPAAPTPFDPQVLTALRALGHTVNAPADIGSVQFVAIDPRTGRLYGGADARREGTVIGVGKPGRD